MIHVHKRASAPDLVINRKKEKENRKKVSVVLQDWPWVEQTSLSRRFEHCPEGLRKQWA